MSIMTTISNNENFLFNGFDFELNLGLQGYKFFVNDTRGRGIFGKEIQTKKVVGVDGVTVLDTSLPSRTIEVDYTLIAPSLSELRSAESFMTMLLQQKESSSLYFSDQEGYYNAIFQNVDVSYEDARVQQGTITFFCPKPFRYKDMVTAYSNHPLQANELILLNTESNYFSLPVIELKLTQEATKLTLEAGDSTISIEPIVYTLKVNDVLIFDSEKLECRLNGELKVLEVSGTFPTLYTLFNGVRVDVPCLLTLKYRGVDV